MICGVGQEARVLDQNEGCRLLAPAAGHTGDSRRLNIGRSNNGGPAGLHRDRAVGREER